MWFAEVHANGCQYLFLAAHGGLDAQWLAKLSGSCHGNDSSQYNMSTCFIFPHRIRRNIDNRYKLASEDDDTVTKWLGS